MENYIEISNQYGKLSSLYSVRNLLQAEINREEEKLKELKKESEIENGKRKYNICNYLHKIRW